MEKLALIKEFDLLPVNLMVEFNVHLFFYFEMPLCIEPNTSRSGREEKIGFNDAWNWDKVDIRHYFGVRVSI